MHDHRCADCAPEFDCWNSPSQCQKKPDARALARCRAPEYDPLESLSAEVDRFKTTNRFNPLNVTHLYAQAACVVSELRNARQQIAAMKSAPPAIAGYRLTTLIACARRLLKSRYRKSQLWVLVRDLTGSGSTTASELCRAAGFDPTTLCGAKHLKWPAARVPPAEVPRMGWVPVGEGLPADGEWVLHTYCGVRAPEYGIFKDGRFWRESGPESFPTTHWLPVPMIPSTES